MKLSHLKGESFCLFLCINLRIYLLIRILYNDGMRRLLDTISNKKGFTLIELIIIVVILGILILIAVAVFTGTVVKAQVSTDYANLRILNSTTVLYGQTLPNGTVDIFDGITEDEVRMQTLVDESYIIATPKTKQKDVAFIWDIDTQCWYLLYEESLEILLTPFGNTFDDIVSGMVDAINSRYDAMGSYGRTWGDYRYGDIGLNVDDWENPINHIIYKPKGSQLDITPEDGYEFTVTDIYNNVLRVYENYNLIYNVLDGKWYYRAISDGIVVDISTLVIVKK